MNTPMIELTPAGLTALILATVFLTSMIWLGVWVILAGRDTTAEAMKDATEEMRAAASLIQMTDADRNAQYERAFNDGASDGWQNAMNSMHEEEAV